MEILEQLFSLKGKKALITGGYRGIGLLMAETYAEAGADVALAARNLKGCLEAAEKIAGKHGVKALGKYMDVRDSQKVDSVVNEVARELGGIDILVNAAGVPGAQKPVLEMTDEDLDDAVGIDFRGTFVVSRAAGRIMARQKSGRIINIASIMAKISTRYMSAYCASKAAVVQLTRVMALELMRDNVQINALCPGYILTDFNRDFFQSDTGKKLIKKMMPMNRVGTLDELKSTALYLATCPPLLTGAEIYIDGGHTLV